MCGALKRAEPRISIKEDLTLAEFSEEDLLSEGASGPKGASGRERAIAEGVWMFFLEAARFGFQRVLSLKHPNREVYMGSVYFCCWHSFWSWLGQPERKRGFFYKVTSHQ